MSKLESGNGIINDGFEQSPENQIHKSKNESITELSQGAFVKEELQINDAEKQDENERPNWSNSIEFLMSCISMSVGLGNIWRFPFTAYENGGGAFLIPYIIVLLLIGKPMYYLEMILGQFTSKSSIRIWSLSPLLRGVGIGQMVATVSVITYYCSLIALTVFYMVMSFQAELPWAVCREEWGPDCVDSKPKENATPPDGLAQSSSELYFLQDVLNEKNQINDGIGVPSWKLTIALFASWVVIFLVIVRGVKSSGKAAYFLALFPYVVLIILLIRAVTLEGAVDGILFFLTPKWDELLNPKVWKEAIVQCFFSLAIGLGPIIMFSSYNVFRHGLYRDAIIVTTLDTFTSLLAGVTIFGILGNLAHNLGIDDISKVVKSGTGLAFISYPDAIAKFDVVPQLFAVLFFFMLFVLGIGSVVALQSAVVSVLCDQFKSFKFWIVGLVTCIIGFFTGLIYITPGGQWMLNLVDYFGGTFVAFALAIVEMMGVFWIYGLESFCDDVKFMLNRDVSVYWRVCWAVVTPGFMSIILVYSLSTMELLTYSGWTYPTEAYVAGWTLLAIGFIQFPLWAAWTYSQKYEGGFWETIKRSARASAEWGPSSPTVRAEWVKFKADALEERKRLSEEKGHGWWERKLSVLLGRY